MVFQKKTLRIWPWLRPDRDLSGLEGIMEVFEGGVDGCRSGLWAYGAVLQYCSNSQEVFGVRLGGRPPS